MKSSIQSIDGDESETNTASPANGSSAKFLEPMKNRLKNLLQSVKEEAGSFAEIRQRHRDRGDERTALKSRAGGRIESERLAAASMGIQTASSDAGTNSEVFLSTQKLHEKFEMYLQTSTLGIHQDHSRRSV